MKYIKKYKQKFDTIQKLLNKDDPVIIEIGAHFGEDSLRFLEYFNNIKLYCFEPDPRNIKVFKKYVEDDRVDLIELALYDHRGKSTFYQSFQNHKGSVPDKYDWISEDDYHSLMLNNSGSSSLQKGYYYNLSDTIQVDTERYDNWAEENGIKFVDLAWIDVQGAERSVLDGMGGDIHNIMFVWVEYGENVYEGAMSREEIIRYMNDKLFSVVEQYSDQAQSGDLLFLNSNKKNT
jgi:FkbM family methyltransferase